MNNNRIITSDIISIFYHIRLNAFSFFIVKKPLDLQKNKKYLFQKNNNNNDNDNNNNNNGNNNKNKQYRVKAQLKTFFI